MATFIQEVLGLLARKKTVKTIELGKDYFQLGRRRDALLLTAGYNPEMDPYIIKGDDLICQIILNIATGNPNFIPVFGPVPPSGCPIGPLINSHIYQDPAGGTIHIYNDTDGVPTGTNLNYALTVARGELGVARNRTVLLDNIDLGRPRLAVAPNTRGLVFGRNAGAAMFDYGLNSTSIFIGDFAANNYGPVTNQDVVIGTFALSNTSISNNGLSGLNVVIGYSAATIANSLSDSVVIGNTALAGNGSDVSRVVVIGGGAAFNSLSSFSDCVLIGQEVTPDLQGGLRNTIVGTIGGTDLTTGNNNTFLGYNSGDGIITGSGNTILGGFHSAPLSATLSNYVLILNGNGDQRVTIDNIGRSGLNQASPSAWLDVRGTGSAYPMLQLDSSDPVSYLEYTGVPTSGTQQWHVGTSQGGNNGTDNIMYFISDNTGATPQAFSIQRNTGNVGIGTYAPDTKLRVVGAAKVGTLGYLSLYDQAAGAEITSISNKLFIGTATANDLELYTNSTTRVTITGSGLVGIGTSTITQLLHVGGNVRIEGALYDSTNGSGLATQFLKSTVTGIQWASAVTSVDASGGTTGLTFTGGPVTDTGTLTLSGTLNAVNGGTGLTSYTIGDILYANSTTTLTQLSAGTAGTVLTSGGPGLPPTWTAVGGTGTVTSVDGSGGTTGLTLSGGPITTSGTLTLGGVLIEANGGTGFSSFTQGDILYGDVTAGLSLLPAGLAGQVLSSGGPGADPSWITVGGTGTVTSVDVNGGGTGLTFTGGPITTTGIITMGGVLDYPHGGTGVNATALPNLQDHLGLKSCVLHYRWEDNPSAPYFNFINGVATEIPFNAPFYASTKGTATGITTTLTPTTCRFTCNDGGYYRITLRIHFYDQTNNVDVIASLYNVTAGLVEQGIIDDKSVEANGDKLITSVLHRNLTAGVVYSIFVNFSGGAVNPFPSNANSMVTEVVFESVDLF